MAYDKYLAERVRQLLKRRNGFSERKMFGGICFMLGGNMCCGVTSTELMLRLGPEGYEHDDDLNSWVARAAKFASSLPAK